MSTSAASGPEHVSTSSASMVTVHDATHGAPAIIRSQLSSTGSMRPWWNARMGLVVHAVHALDHGLLHLLDDLAALAGVRVDPVDSLVVHQQFEVLGPAAVAAKPAPYLAGALHHDYWRVRATPMLAT